jgi:hypothetical protein
MNNEQTSKYVASLASKLLKDRSSSSQVKSLAGSALTQAPNRNVRTAVEEQYWNALQKAQREADEANVRLDQIRGKWVLEYYRRIGKLA